jgi:hypothetical protein
MTRASTGPLVLAMLSVPVLIVSARSGRQNRSITVCGDVRDDAAVLRVRGREPQRAVVLFTSEVSSTPEISATASELSAVGSLPRPPESSMPPSANSRGEWCDRGKPKLRLGVTCH